jgi:hypothetical protein
MLFGKNSIREQVGARDQKTKPKKDYVGKRKWFSPVNS